MFKQTSEVKPPEAQAERSKSKSNLSPATPALQHVHALLYLSTPVHGRQLPRPAKDMLRIAKVPELDEKYAFWQCSALVRPAASVKRSKVCAVRQPLKININVRIYIQHKCFT